MSDDARKVLDALPEQGLLVLPLDIRARTGMPWVRIRRAISELHEAELVVLRQPFDTGRPERWGRA